ncbi:Type I restriction-modification system, specificity subunit S [Pseudomonas chlororaphis subsp. aureofaciens]|nr:Type I restriction-modification system, specificity subunit S [Pseudomonas chlororaphis subsp. aureofaciens]
MPRDWEVRPLKRVADFINGAAFKPSEWAESGIPIIRIENLNGGENFNHFLGDLNPRYIVEPGDLLFGWSGNRGTSFGPYIWSKEGRYALNQHIFRVVFDDLDPQWFFWSLVAVTSHVEDQAHGIIGMVHVTKSDLGAIKIPFPSEREQHLIAAFLDRETAKIDGLVAEQEKLIALLKVKRQAVIAHAVTKGLDPAVQLKDSRVEWLGEVPVHWQVNRVKHFVNSFNQGWSPQCESFSVVSEDEWGVLKVGCVNGGIFNPEENKSLPTDLDPLPELGIRKGDLLISRANTRELVGSAAVALRDYPNLLLCDKLYRLRLDNVATSAEFVAYYLSIGQVRGQIELSASGASSSMVNISQATILELVIALPTDKEQREIVAFIESEQTQLNALISEALQAIALLKERRTALITATVTGQIDVRGLVKDEQEQAA